MFTCPICHSTDIEIKYRLSFNVYQCNKCKFQFAPDASFNDSLVSDVDNVSHLKALKELRILNFGRIVSSLIKNVDSHDYGLEVGSGHGWFLDICKANGIMCYGIEPETCYNENHKKLGVKVLNGFFPEVVPPDTKYGFIAYNDVFEHLPNIESIMKTNKMLLSDNGKLIINLPIRSGVIYVISELLYNLGVKSIINRMWQFNFYTPHLSYFSKKNLIKYAESADFELLESFPLKTIHLSKIKDRINEDKNSKIIFKYVSIIGISFLYPILQLFPDTYCFIFKKKK